MLNPMPTSLRDEGMPRRRAECKLRPAIRVTSAERIVKERMWSSCLRQSGGNCLVCVLRTRRFGLHRILRMLQTNLADRRRDFRNDVWPVGDQW